MQPEILDELIERAAKECGTKTALAEKMGISAQRLNDWRTGYRPCPPEQVAILADIAGLVAEEWLVRATLYHAREKPYYQRLEQAVGKWLPRTGAAALTCLLIASLGGFPAGSQAAELVGKCSTMCKRLTIRAAILIKTISQKLRIYNSGSTWFFAIDSAA